MSMAPTTDPTADSAHSPARPAAGDAPTALPAAAPAAVFLALVLLGLGVVALRDTAVTLQWLPGTPWLDTVIHGVDGLRFAWWMIPAGLAALLLGLILVTCALRPRRKTAVAVTAASSVWISPWDLAGVATHAANSVPGVFDARTAATRRTLAVSASVTDAALTDAKTAEVQTAVHAATQITSAPMKITVRIRPGVTS